MKLAPAIEEFIQYKQALGNSYTSPARDPEGISQENRKSRIRCTHSATRRRISAQSMAPQLRMPGFIGTGHSAAFSASPRAVVTCNIEYFPHRSLIARRSSFPIFIRLKISVGCWECLIRTTRRHALCRQTRMRTLILVLYGTGLRLGEAIA